MKFTKIFAIALSSAILVACGGGDSDPSPVNTAPVAQAGLNQSAAVGQVVTLDGSSSSDADQDSLTYRWTLATRPAGSAAVLLEKTSAKPSFVADVSGVYLVTLVVDDGQVSSAAASVTVTASSSNAAPVARAGATQNVLAGDVVTLDGSASSDANDDSLTYSWILATRPEGSSALLQDPTSVRPTFTADLAGMYSATLVVSDGQLNSEISVASVTASNGNAIPVANAGEAQNVVVGTTVILDGSTSSDANGDPITYKWMLTSKPESSSTSLDLANSSRPTLTVDRPGTYVATLVVNDGKADSAGASVTVTASVANAAPVAQAGPAQTVAVGSIVTLDGSASTDADKDELAYSWTLTAKPANSAAVLNDSLIAAPKFTADVAGDYVATLIVSDGKISSAAATVAVKATAAQAISLFSISDPFFGSATESKQSWPYASVAAQSRNETCVGNRCPVVVDVATFKLVGTGQNFTITNLSANNLTSGSPVSPVFSGLANGQIVGDGDSVTFKLQSPFTKGSTVKLQYSFTIAPTGETFKYTVELQTN